MAFLHHLQYPFKLALLITQLFIARLILASPVNPKPASVSRLISRVLAFRVTRYSEILNRIAESTAVQDEHVLQERSLTQKSIKAAVIIGLTIALIVVVAIASLVTAATLSVLSFNKIYLRVIADEGTAKEKEYAQMVLKLRKRPYSMICAFVFTGSAMAELIPLLVSLIIQEASQGTVSGNFDAISIVVAVFLIIFFVELLPLGYTVRKALFVNKFLIRFSEIIFVIWYPLTFPISYLLEKIYELDAKSAMNRNKSIRFANTEERFFSNKELLAFIRLHIMSSSLDSGNVHKIVADIVKGAFKLQSLRVKDVMTDWDDLLYLNAIIRSDAIIYKDQGMALYGNGLDGGLLLEVEDASDYMRKYDIGMVPLGGKKVKGFISWTSFTANLGDGPSRAERLITEPMPVIFDCFEDPLELISLFQHGTAKMALVVVTPPRMNEKTTPNLPPHPIYPVSTTKVYWSNQEDIMAYVKPVGVISHQTLQQVVFGKIGHSKQELPDPMAKYASRRLTVDDTRELLRGIHLTYEDDRGPDWRKDSGAAYSTTSSVGVLDKVVGLGSRRRTGTLVNQRSPVSSIYGSVLDATEDEWATGGKEKEKEKETGFA
ncbi:Metal transporter cnnm4 [Orbilia brochopaga]|uniref:Metal transporter cnnm4 n=1 Tax=Orbilia brochopaga TaxID=3140254 RepID=A0AAV9V0F0_9PEZI